MARWIDKIIDRLATARRWSYLDGGAAAAEPTALASLALLGHRRAADAERAIDWLTRTQTPRGTVGVTAEQASPHWPTALAVLAWQAWHETSGTTRYRGCIDRAIRWTVNARGGTAPRSPQVGHDTTLVGWPWVEGTHSWLEPTAYFVLALQATGHADHPRTREGRRLIVDRLLPSGGANYGNTVVMGQELLPHVQPTGLALLALAGATDSDARIDRSIDYLERSLGTETASASLAFGLLGLTAHNRRPADAGSWLQSAASRRSQPGRGAYADALLALAALEPPLRVFS